MAQLRLISTSHFKNKPDCRVLVLASKNDRLVNYQCSLKTAKDWACELHIHQTAGHDLPLDDTNWIIKKIQSVFKY